MMPNLIPTPYRILAGAAATLLVVLATFALGWRQGATQVQARWSRASAEQLQAALDAEQRHRAQELDWNRKLQEAEHAATEREQKLRADSAAAHAAARGLRNDLADLRAELPAATLATLHATADAALAVLGECADQYQAVASAADGHAGDAQTLTEAWPQ